MGGHNKLNLVGQRFTMLEVLEEAGRDGRQQTLWKCKCDCGNELTTVGARLRKGHVKSCGCLRVIAGREVGLSSAKHGHGRVSGKTPTYNSWQSMLDRCTNKDRRTYKWYGAKGITVCDRWQSFDNFLADMGERPKGTTLDRIDTFGNYEPSNCRWADKKTQSNNTSASVNVTVEGVTKTIMEWSKSTGIPYTTLQYRVHAGWDVSKLFER